MTHKKTEEESKKPEKGIFYKRFFIVLRTLSASCLKVFLGILSNLLLVVCEVVVRKSSIIFLGSFFPTGTLRVASTPEVSCTKIESREISHKSLANSAKYTSISYPSQCPTGKFVALATSILRA